MCCHCELSNNTTMTCSQVLLLAVISFASVGVGLGSSSLYPADLCCPAENEVDGTVETLCDDVFDVFESAVTSRKSNLNQLRKAFFYASHADPILLKIDYVLSFSENVTTLESETRYCSKEDLNDSLTYTIFNHTNVTVITYGWTSNGIYTVVHPALLNLMQLQIPLTVVRLIHLLFQNFRKRHAIIGMDSPQTEVFLWDGLYELPTVTLYIHINSIPCIPSDRLVDFVLQDITSLVRVYAARSIFSDSTADSIGFPLNETSTTPFTNIYFYGIGYCFIYFSLIPIFIFFPAMQFFEFTRNATYLKSTWFKKLKALVIVTIYLEAICEFVWSVVWSTKLDAWTIKVVWVMFLFCRLCPLLILTLGVFGKLQSFQLPIITSVVSSFIVPTVLSLLVFPTLIIATGSYFAAFYFALIVFSSMLEHDKKCGLPKFNQVLYVLTCTFFIVLMSILLYVIALGKSSVISLSFYGILSLLPSAALTGVTWLYNKIVPTQLENVTEENNDSRIGERHTNGRNEERDESKSEELISSTNKGTDSRNEGKTKRKEREENKNSPHTTHAETEHEPTPLASNSDYSANTATQDIRKRTAATQHLPLIAADENTPLLKKSNRTDHDIV